MWTRKGASGVDKKNRWKSESKWHIMKIRTFVWMLVIGFTILGTEGCRKGPSASKKNSKKIRKGKPVPCPMKDC